MGLSGRTTGRGGGGGWERGRGGKTRACSAAGSRVLQRAEGCPGRRTPRPAPHQRAPARPIPYVPGLHVHMPRRCFGRLLRCVSVLRPGGAARSYQAHGDRLQGDVLRLGDELETQKLNLRDINEFLTNELKVGVCISCARVY